MGVTPLTLARASSRTGIEGGAGSNVTCFLSQLQGQDEPGPSGINFLLATAWLPPGATFIHSMNGSLCSCLSNVLLATAGWLCRRGWGRRGSLRRRRRRRDCGAEELWEGRLRGWGRGAVLLLRRRQRYLFHHISVSGALSNKDTSLSSKVKTPLWVLCQPPSDVPHFRF